MSVVLAIETSQRAGGVAVRTASERTGVEMLRASARHDDDLMPAIDRLCARLDLRPVDLDAVGVSIGPGGFTGLRIGLSTAKILGETLGAAILAIPSALVAAEAYGASGEDSGPILVALAAKSGTVWSTRLARGDQGWTIWGTPGLAGADDIDLAGLTAMVADRHLPETIRGRCAEADLPVVEPVFDPRACLAVAERWLDSGRITDPLQLAPIYPRPPEAVTIWNRRRDQA